MKAPTSLRTPSANVVEVQKLKKPAADNISNGMTLPESTKISSRALRSCGRLCLESKSCILRVAKSPFDPTSCEEAIRTRALGQADSRKIDHGRVEQLLVYASSLWHSTAVTARRAISR